MSHYVLALPNGSAYPTPTPTQCVKELSFINLRSEMTCFEEGSHTA